MSPISSRRMPPSIEVSSAPSASRRMAAVIWPIGFFSVSVSAMPARSAITTPVIVAATEI